MKKITIIGTGYVGLVSGAGISDFGHQVTCVDIDENKINLLNNGKIPIYEPGLNELVDKNTKAGRLIFTTDLKKAVDVSEVIFIAVGTPMSDNGEADLKYVKSAAITIGEYMKSYKVICTKSTVPVGTGSWISDLIGSSSRNNTPFDYVSNPEFLREGSAVKDFIWPDRVVIGASNKKSFEILKEVYEPLYRNKRSIIHTSIVTAEMIKYAANAFLALKISYINEVANLCEIVGADVYQVSKAMGQDGRISPKFLHPGPGFGGSCFPKDTEAFASLFRKNGLALRTIEAAIETNVHQKLRMVEKLKKLLGNTLKNKTIAVLGLSFKPNTDDVRESSSIILIENILSGGGNVQAYDPIANNAMMHFFPNINYCEKWEDACEGADCVAIMTEWNEFRAISLKILKLKLRTPIILDTRNIINVKKLKENNFKFDNIGNVGLEENEN